MKKIYAIFVLFGYHITKHAPNNPLSFVLKTVMKNKDKVASLALLKFLCEFLKLSAINLEKICDIRQLDISKSTQIKITSAFWALSPIVNQLEVYLGNKIIYFIFRDILFRKNLILNLLDKKRSFYKHYGSGKIIFDAGNLIESTVSFIDSSIFCMLAVILQGALAYARSDSKSDPDFWFFIVAICLHLLITTTFKYSWPNPVDYEDLLNNIELAQEQGQQKIEAHKIQSQLLLNVKQEHSIISKQQFLQNLSDILLVMYFFRKAVFCTGGDWGENGDRVRILQKGFSSWNSLGTIKRSIHQCMSLGRKLHDIEQGLILINAEGNPLGGSRKAVTVNKELTIKLSEEFKYP